MDTQERDQQMFMDRIAGDSLPSIASRNTLSATRTREIVIREGTNLVNQLELDLMVAAKTGTDFPTFVVPFQQQDGWQVAMRHFQWALDRLRKRDVQVTVVTKQTKAGAVFLLEPKEQ